MSKGDKLRQIRCRFLSLFATPLFERIFSNEPVGGWCLGANASGCWQDEREIFYKGPDS